MKISVCVGEQQPGECGLAGSGVGLPHAGEGGGLNHKNGVGLPVGASGLTHTVVFVDVWPRGCRRPMLSGTALPLLAVHGVLVCCHADWTCGARIGACCLHRMSASPDQGLWVRVPCHVDLVLGSFEWGCKPGSPSRTALPGACPRAGGMSDCGTVLFGQEACPSVLKGGGGGAVSWDLLSQGCQHVFLGLLHNGLVGCLCEEYRLPHHRCGLEFAHLSMPVNGKGGVP